MTGIPQTQYPTPYELQMNHPEQSIATDNGPVVLRGNKNMLRALIPKDCKCQMYWHNNAYGTRVGSLSEGRKVWKFYFMIQKVNADTFTTQKNFEHYYALYKMCTKRTHIGLAMSVCLSVHQNSTRKSLDGFEWNLVRTVWHWRLSYNHTSQIPTNGRTNMANERSCELVSTLAPLTTAPYNDNG